MNIEVKGSYVYINNHPIKFNSDSLALDFVTKLIKESV